MLDLVKRILISASVVTPIAGCQCVGSCKSSPIGTPTRIYMGHERDELVEYIEQADGRVSLGLLNPNHAAFLRFNGHLNEDRNSMIVQLIGVSDSRLFVVGVTQRSGGSLVLENMRGWIKGESIEMNLVPRGIDWDYQLSHPKNGFMTDFSEAK